MTGAPVELASFPQPGRCAYFVERKKRFCKMVPAQGRRFCGEHSAEEEEHKRKRIPCPLDPKHTVYEDQLQKHLKKCNSREKPKPVYFIKDINAGLKNETELSEEQQIRISALSKQELENLIRKLKKANNAINYVLKDQILSHHALQEALNDPQNGDAAFKHLKQQASILGNMKRLHLLGPGNCFVEFGAGRGKLSHWLDIALQDVQDVHFLLVERESTRFKVDGKHRKRYFERLQVDIQHLCLNLALRCLVDTYRKSGLEEKEGPVIKRLKTDCSGKIHSKCATENWSPIAGIVIALCCHHKCEWRHYVGQDFFTRVGLGPIEFNFFKRMTSWATCGMRERGTETSRSGIQNEGQRNEGEHDQDDINADCSLDSLQRLLTAEERKQIGHLCKLLIDHGRIEYLEQRRYEAALQRYTESSVSLENVLLTAVPAQSS
ncbi:tRNA:m(4)X modification enzyme TRM13 homolog isoform X3 [Crotalus tigris]|uniref:tRNA:m(4)X modification enzyme TRM13 homolog isoform X3 n=1 Tax=Crotalus tigris TaxID=88082 RepID=UPI00192F68A7|nr:tRNA:m(4)X modification enzyme TRM13 homolog isoform X3 [Crotalus tigris]